MANDRAEGEKNLSVMLEKAGVVGHNMKGEIERLGRMIELVPAATGSAAQKKVADLRLGDIVLTAMCKARVARVRDWAIRTHGWAVAMTWDELKNKIENELVAAETATKMEEGIDLATMTRKPDETISSFVARFTNKAEMLGADLQNDMGFGFVMARTLLTRGLRHADLEARASLRISLGACETWPEFEATLRAEAAGAWTRLPPPPAPAATREGYRPRPGRTTLTWEERNERKAKGLCFVCNKPGIARDCPNHAPPQSGNGGAGGGR
jgi:hypothetical protein